MAVTLKRYGPVTRWSGVVMALFLWAIALGLLVTGLALIAASQPGIGLFLLGLGALLCPLCRVVHRDVMAKWRWRVEISRDGIALTLPANRSWLHAPDGFEGRIDLRDVRAIIVRPEVYYQLGTATHTEPWWLVLKGGERILLGEDRQVSNAYATMTDTVFRAAEAISSASGIAIRRLPEAEGHAGFLGIWGAVPPAWPDQA